MERPQAGSSKLLRLQSKNMSTALYCLRVIPFILSWNIAIMSSTSICRANNFNFSMRNKTLCYCQVAQLVECLVTSGYPDGSSSGGPSLAREKTGKWKHSHPAVAEHDCPEINSSQRWCLCKKKTPMWYGATETWAAAGLLSLARRKTTSCGNGWLETMRRHV